MFYLPDDDTGNALARIAAEGSDLNKPMKIEFFIAVENKKDGEDIATNIDKFTMNHLMNQLLNQSKTKRGSTQRKTAKK